MSDAKEQVAGFQQDFQRIEKELGKVIVGHHDVIRSVLPSQVQTALSSRSPDK